MKSRPSRRAVVDIEAEVTRLAVTAGEATAVRFLEAVKAGVARIEQFPRIGSPRLWRNQHIVGVRSWPVPGFPGHLIFYRVTSKGIRILRLLRPGVQAETTLLTPTE